MAVNGASVRPAMPSPSAPLPTPASTTKKTVSAAGPAPSTAPPAPPTTSRAPPRANSTTTTTNHAGHATTSTTTPSTATTGGKAKKRADPTPPDPTALYENVKNRIAALEEDVRHVEEEERRAADEARDNIKGIADSVIQTKYIELFQEMKRMERDFGKEKQKLVKEKDASKSQLTKANVSKTKLEGIARELQKDTKKLRDDNKRLQTGMEDARDEIRTMKDEVQRHSAQSKKKERMAIESPEIVIKVVSKYRPDLFFKISRKSKMSLLFKAWTDRTEVRPPLANANVGGVGKKSTKTPVEPSRTQFIFCHMGRSLEPDQTPEELDIEGGDEILAVELVDLTVETAEPYVPPVQRETLEKQWTENPKEAKAAIEDIFNGVVRERLKNVLRQYELREKHFECIIRSKELEIMVSRARADEQKRMAEEQHRQQVEEVQDTQTRLMEKFADYCREPTAERTQQLFDFLRGALEKRGAKLPPESLSSEALAGGG